MGCRCNERRAMLRQAIGHAKSGDIELARQRAAAVVHSMADDVRDAAAAAVRRGLGSAAANRMVSAAPVNRED